MKKLLLFEYRDICYSSFPYFSECIRQEYEKMGYQVEVCRFTNETVDKLEKYAGEKFDKIIDFNSLLPSAQLDSGEYLLDKIDAPFYNYLLDHPLYHHTYLKVPLRNYHIICIDRGHADYVRRQYRHFKSVNFLPIAGAGECANQEKEYDISLSGTYTSPRKVMDIIQTLAPELKKGILELIDRMQADTTCTMEQAVEQILLARGNPYSNREFAEFMHLHFWADMYIRAYYRHKVMEQIVSEGITLHVLGYGYQDYRGKGKENLVVHKCVPFTESIDFIAKSRISLNVMPGFKEGSHDRIFTAMLNHSVMLTDGSTYLQEILQNEKNVLFYQMERLDELTHRIRKYLSCPAELNEIQQNAYALAKAGHTWEAHCKEIEKFISV